MGRPTPLSKDNNAGILTVNSPKEGHSPDYSTCPMSQQQHLEIRVVIEHVTSIRPLAAYVVVRLAPNPIQIVAANSVNLTAARQGIAVGQNDHLEE